MKKGVILAILVLGIFNPSKDVETALNSNLEPFTQVSEQPLTEIHAEQVKAMWRVIATQEIVNWDGEMWLGFSQKQKEEAVTQSCEAWKIAGYQKRPSVDFLVKDISEYYQHFIEMGDKEGVKTKVGLTLSMSAFFGGMERE